MLRFLLKMKQGNFCKRESKVAKLHFFCYSALVVPQGSLVGALGVTCRTQLLELS